IERDGTINENLPETHEILKRLRRELDVRYGDRMLLAEANQWPEDVLQYFGAGDECHMAFHFPLMPRIYMAVSTEDRHPITDIMRQTPDIPETCQWAVFLRNHDELTLEMVTDRERDYLWNYYAADRRARINLGIRRRLAPLMENDRRKIELLKGLLLSMPGTPVAPGIGARQAAVPLSVEPQGDRLSARMGRRDHPLRRQSGAIGAGGRTGSLRMARPARDRGAGAHGVPDDRRAPVHADFAG